MHMKGKTITATKTSLSTIVYIVVALMLSTAVIYFVVASESYSEISKLTSQSTINKDALSEIMGITNELIFFTIVGIAYIIVGFWIIKRKYHSKVPYIVAIAGSASIDCLLYCYSNSKCCNYRITNRYRYNRYSIKDSTRFNNCRFIIRIGVI